MSDNWVCEDLGIECDAFECGIEQGRQTERDAVVEWLRSLDFADPVEHLLTKAIAGWIERGEYLGGDDEA